MFQKSMHILKIPKTLANCLLGVHHNTSQLLGICVAKSISMKILLFFLYFATENTT